MLNDVLVGFDIQPSLCLPDWLPLGPGNAS